MNNNNIKHHTNLAELGLKGLYKNPIMVSASRGNNTNIATQQNQSHSCVMPHAIQRTFGTPRINVNTGYM